MICLAGIYFLFLGMIRCCAVRWVEDRPASAFLSLICGDGITEYRYCESNQSLPFKVKCPGRIKVTPSRPKFKFSIRLTQPSFHDFVQLKSFLSERPKNKGKNPDSRGN